ncbi:MAG: hypothetical protein COT81_04515 [Candidatus Buchananbacteria bacterium CG10_big_fil_rev_8_21_14_0_10_42_9]|uniref:Uncharacterized protein n=1 Tax=Candidatus Buchananbacteria bacterium CG10_big_fil_rev_8_21_14_0_10_42_9 TaxID=1974526 RepID=A0A2H0W0A2_9BACT|nr:MAG: hypothetical protein COT81_04515 [Candidatus Buchananbacteria bacterium CG10_big_fil_rev_8_21_14_0_10_42_9]
MPEGEKPHQPNIENPDFDFAKERSNRSKEAFASSGISTIDALLEEVRGMDMSDSFDPEEIPSENPSSRLSHPSTTARMRGKNAPEAQRESLIIRLKSARNDLVRLAARVEGIVMLMETSKKRE